MEKLLYLLAEMGAQYLIRQLQAGADCVQIFDSWAGVLDEAAFEDYAVKPVAYMVDVIRAAVPDAKIIGFAKGAGALLDGYRERTKVNGVGLDWSVPLSQAKRLQQGGAVQGNLDPLRLIAGGKALEDGIDSHPGRDRRRSVDLQSRPRHHAGRANRKCRGVVEAHSIEGSMSGKSKSYGRPQNRAKSGSGNTKLGGVKALGGTGGGPGSGSGANISAGSSGKTGGTRSGRGRIIGVMVVAALLVIALFLFVPDSALLWVKAAHVFFIISWMAGMLYLPRLFVYHTECGANSAPVETFKTMERRLLKGIMTPSMLVTWVLGIWLAIHGGWFAMDGGNGWLHAKIALVVVMSGVHGYYAGSTKRLARGELRRSAKFWRLMNEVPAVLLALILILVIVKPF